MEITCYVSKDFSLNYMPFLLYRRALNLILLKNNIGKTVQVTDNINLLTKKKEKQIVIMNLYCLNAAIENGNNNIFSLLENMNAYVILINTEFINWNGYNLRDYLTTINSINQCSSTFYIFEYNNINYKYIKETYLNVNVIFIPMLYHESSEKFFLKNINAKLSWSNKDIDVLFYGTINSRRQEVLDKLKLTYPDKNIVYFLSENNNTFCNLIERSKIVLNVIFYENNVIFDYYRNSFLITNKCLLISEEPTNIDILLEPGLKNANEYIIFTSYDKLVEVVGDYLNKSENEINNIIEKQFNWYKSNNNMEEAIMNKIKSSELVLQEKRNISLFKVFMSEDVIKPLNEVVMSGFITQGPQVDKFEEKLVEYFLNPHILTLNSATSGLTLALRLLLEPDSGYEWPGFDVENDYILSPALTCFATNASILANNCKIKWIDTDNTTANVSIPDVKNKLSDKTKILYLVHWGGYPVDLDALKELQEEHYNKYGYRFRIIEDCAHAFGASYKNKKLGNHDNICVFSLQAIKHLTTGDGGLIILPTQKLYDRAKLLRWFGIDRDKRNYNRKDFRMENDIAEWGYKFHMNDINATIGIYNLPHIEGLLIKNRSNYQYLYENLKEIQDVTLLENNCDRETSAWLFTMRVQRKPEFIEKMKTFGIATSQVHNRNDLNSCVKDFKSELPGISELEKELICIPVGWWLEIDDLDYMVEKIKWGW
jgi:dTDP-4-amino-4,6-dideoxygalactose transaminase